MNPTDEFKKLISLFPRSDGLFASAEHIPAALTPEPYKRLLVHDRHMTITMEEFHRLQEILGRPDRSRPKRHEFAFVGLFTCGSCARTLATASRMATCSSVNSKDIIPPSRIGPAVAAPRWWPTLSPRRPAFKNKSLLPDRQRGLVTGPCTASWEFAMLWSARDGMHSRPA